MLFSIPVGCFMNCTLIPIILLKTFCASVYTYKNRGQNNVTPCVTRPMPVTWLSRKSTNQFAKCIDNKHFTLLSCSEYFVSRHVFLLKLKWNRVVLYVLWDVVYLVPTLVRLVRRHSLKMRNDSLLSSINVVLVMAYGSLVSPFHLILSDSDVKLYILMLKLYYLI